MQRFLYCLAVASVGLTVTGEPWVDIDQNTTVTCSVSTAQLLIVNWRKGPLGASSSVSQPIVLYDATSFSQVTWDYNVNRSHFLFDESMNDFPLTIISLVLEDEGRYWCRALDDETFSTSTEKTEILVRGKTQVYLFITSTSKAMIVLSQACSETGRGEKTMKMFKL